MQFNLKKYSVVRIVKSNGSKRDYPFFGQDESNDILNSIDSCDDIESIEIGVKDEMGNFRKSRSVKKSKIERLALNRIMISEEIHSEKNKQKEFNRKGLSNGAFIYTTGFSKRKVFYIILVTEGRKPLKLFLREGIICSEEMIIRRLSERVDLPESYTIEYGFSRFKKETKILTIKR